MPKDDPPRLKQSRDAPPQLVRALEALRKGADETARLERVARKLGPLLDAPPNLSRVASGAQSNATIMKLCAGGLALLIPALWFALEPSEPAPAQTASAPKANTNEAPAAPSPEPALAAPDTTDKPITTAPIEATRHAHGRVTRNVKARERQQPSAATDTSTDSPPRSESAQSPAPHEPIVTPPTAATPNPDADNAKPTAPAPPTEAQLLFDARKAMPNDAARALQLLDEHAKRYPNGQLVPEREVLAIEALRSLGRKTEADARLQRFEARYPNSFHLERLQH